MRNTLCHLHVVFFLHSQESVLDFTLSMNASFIFTPGFNLMFLCINLQNRGKSFHHVFSIHT